LHLSPQAQPSLCALGMSISAAETGFDETRFVQRGAATLLSCALCRHAPKVNATLLSCCGQSACAKCITEWGEGIGSSPFGVSCPFCREISTICKDRGYADSLSLAVVRCKYSPCCRWKGPFAIATAHEESGECEVGKLHKDLDEKVAAAVEHKTLLLADADGEVLALTVELRDLRAQEELRAQERHLFSAKSLETEHQLRDARATLTEQNLEILALSAELRAQERDVCRKDATIADQERDVCRKDATIADLVNQLATLAARINDNAQRSYMIQEMLYCPPNVLDAMQKALLPELPELPELPSNPLPSRDRSRTPRGDAPKLLKFPTP
jgi:hypothetical protein